MELSFFEYQIIELSLSYIFQALTIPVFDGDDLRRLGSEITLCRKFLLQARSFR